MDAYQQLHTGRHKNSIDLVSVTHTVKNKEDFGYYKIALNQTDLLTL